MSVEGAVARMGDFLKERAATEEVAVAHEGEFSAKLRRIRDEMNHFIILLVLLAHADGKEVAKEHDVIVEFCLQRLQIEGITLSPDERAAFLTYLQDYRPTRMQLAFALKRLASESKEDLMGLIGAAKAVAESDNVRDEGETRFLETIERDLAGL